MLVINDLPLIGSPTRSGKGFFNTEAFKENGKEMGAIEGNHDDRVMATAILVWVCYNHPLPQRQTIVPTSKKRTRIVSEASI